MKFFQSVFCFGCINLILWHGVWGQSCTIPLPDREPCRGYPFFSANPRGCLIRGCCFSNIRRNSSPRCYQQRSAYPLPQFQGTVPPNRGNGGFGSFEQVGGETNFPGTMMVKRCSAARNRRRCLPSFYPSFRITKGLCQRVGCCWNGGCYRSFFYITSLRRKCAPGFTNDPRCDDVNECASNPCVNGTCVNQINGYKCECQDGFAGVNCEINCRPDPVSTTSTSVVTITSSCTTFQRTLTEANVVFGLDDHATLFMGGDYCEVRLQDINGVVVGILNANSGPIYSADPPNTLFLNCVTPNSGAIGLAMTSVAGPVVPTLYNLDITFMSGTPASSTLLRWTLNATAGCEITYNFNPLNTFDPFHPIYLVSNEASVPTVRLSETSPVTGTMSGTEIKVSFVTTKFGISTGFTAQFTQTCPPTG